LNDIHPDAHLSKPSDIQAHTLPITPSLWGPRKVQIETNLFKSFIYGLAALHITSQLTVETATSVLASKHAEITLGLRTKLYGDVAMIEHNQLP